MTPALENHLRSLAEPQMKRFLAESRKALRTAWPRRNADRRARQVARANVKMLRACRNLKEETE